MSGMHTIFDTRRLNRDDQHLAAELTPEDTTKALQVENEYASSFLADRGELYSAAKRYLWH